VNRRTYMDEANGLRKPQFGRIQSIVAGLLQLFNEFKS
jgi:hypothetical protein